jgi:hypothetical protein
MADNVLKMDYNEADSTIEQIKVVVGYLQEINTELEAIANALEGGALLGKAGDALVAGVRKEAISKINDLSEALTNSADYVAWEKEDMLDAEKQSAALF